MKKIPKYVLKNMRLDSARKFKAQKRWEVKNVLEAIKTLGTGSAYLPSGSDYVMKTSKAMRKLKDELSVKNWGR